MKETHLYTKEQKLEWFGEGEWVTEPDEVKFKHCGFDCLVVRKGLIEPSGAVFGGYFCGYVEIPLDHPWAQTEEYPSVDVHYGVTLFEKTESSCVVGFDCAHSRDIIPSMTLFFRKNGIGIDREKRLDSMIEQYPEMAFLKPTYKNISFAIGETKSMAEQAKQALNEKA